MHLVIGYRFSVRIQNTHLGFQQISGIQREASVETYREGGRNGSVIVLPKGVNKEQHLTLKKGVYLKGSSPFYLVGEAIDTMVIEVFDHDAKTIAKTYTLLNLVITKWQVSELDAQANKLLIDTFEIAYGELHVAS